MIKCYINPQRVQKTKYINCPSGIIAQPQQKNPPKSNLFKTYRMAATLSHLQIRTRAHFLAFTPLRHDGKS